VIPIRCKVCGSPFGVVEAPNVEQVRTALKGTKFQSLAAFIPANMAEQLAPLLAFTCRNCFSLGGQDGSKEGSSKEGSEQASFLEAQQARS
jgi:hypothetical protein